MASVERTAYPRFKRPPSLRELDLVYTLTAEERAFVEGAARGASRRLTLAVLLKSFQHLGYFPPLDQVPGVIITHVRQALQLPTDTACSYDSRRTMYRHHQAIRDRLGVSVFDHRARHVAISAVHRAAQTMDNPADLINVAIEELIRQRWELPAFSTLDRLTRRVRTLVNGKVFDTVQQRLTQAESQQLDSLLQTDGDRQRTAFNALKETPQSLTLTHMKDWQDHLSQLLDIGNPDRLLVGIPPAKVVHFAAEARALDADAMRDILAPKRLTLLVCLLSRAQVTTRDGLADMFVKRMGRLHAQGREALTTLRERQQATTERLVNVLAGVVEVAEDVAQESDAILGERVRVVLTSCGGMEALRDDCLSVTAYNGNNYLPLLWPLFRNHRGTVLHLVRSLDLRPTTQDQSLLQALEFLLAHEQCRGEYLADVIDLDFANEQWQRAVLTDRNGDGVMRRRLFELCVLSHLATDLRNGNLFVPGSDEYADHRTQLLPWEECAPRVAAYCQALGFPETAAGFVAGLKDWLTTSAAEADRAYPENGQLTFNAKGEPVLKRLVRKEMPEGAAELEAALWAHMPERSLLDILCNVDHWTSWTRHFGPPSGADPKLDRAKERYILTCFGYSTNMGPTQLARHTRGLVTPHMVSHINQQHVTGPKLDAARRDMLNRYHGCDLPLAWGSGRAVAADGTMMDVYEENLLAEYHIRYGDYGGIAYHHVSDQYVALVSRFVSCGTWEAIYILDVLFQNLSDIQPTEIHADTQGQATPVFALAHLFGVKLLPRIRNWGNLVFYRPSKEVRYQHIDALFRETIDWDLIETHWQDLLQVVLSIQAGKMLPSTILRRLGTYSRKNRLYQAFRELGCVVRTVFLLQYVSNLELRHQIQRETNKVEGYNGFTKWLHFGGYGVIAENDPEAQDKHIKYLDLLANAVLLQNVADMSAILPELAREGYRVTPETIAVLSPYITRHIKRFGDYIIDRRRRPAPFDGTLPDWLNLRSA